MLLLLASLAPAAHAQSAPALELSWTAPTECPDQARVQAQISRLAPSPAPREQPLRVQGTVRREPRGFTLELLLRDGEFVGQRRFQSDSCTEVVGAAAVTIALLLSSGAEAASGAGATSGASATSSASGSAAVTRKATSEADAESTPLDPARRGEARASASEETGRWRVVLAAPSVSAGFGLLSQPSFGLGGAFALEDDDWRLFVGATWNFDVTVRQSNSTDQGAEVSRGTGRMGACR